MKNFKKLSELLFGFCKVSSDIDRKIEGLTLDSREVQANYLFIACVGEQVDGRNFINAAIKKGACAIVAESLTETAILQMEVGENIPIFYLPNVMNAISEIASRFYENPSQGLQVIGVTGTNGKTSIALYLQQALTSLGFNTGYIGTLGYGTAVDGLTMLSHTTPQAIRVQELLKDFFKKNVSHCAMEVSSHALDQARVKAVNFHSAIFTNLTRDHLDYHHSLENYAAAKQKLFTEFNLKNAIINLDDEWGQIFSTRLPKTTQLFTYSLQKTSKASVKIDFLKSTATGLHLKILSPWGTDELLLPLIGTFNAANALAVLTCLCALGHPWEKILAILKHLRPARGRMDQIPLRNGILAVVDYAHTPDALYQALKALRAHTPGQLICVFGCGGDRDRGKRAQMGEIASRYADQIIITNDNPRHETPENIVADISQGIPSEFRHKMNIILDRNEAILAAVEIAHPQDSILIAGKGHENYQIFGDKILAFSDYDILFTYAASK